MTICGASCRKMNIWGELSNDDIWSELSNDDVWGECTNLTSANDCHRAAVCVMDEPGARASEDDQGKGSKD